MEIPLISANIAVFTVIPSSAHTENEDGKRLLVWSGEHYNLGNALGIVFNKNVNFMTDRRSQIRFKRTASL